MAKANPQQIRETALRRLVTTEIQTRAPSTKPSDSAEIVDAVLGILQDPILLMIENATMAFLDLEDEEDEEDDDLEDEDEDLEDEDEDEGEDD